MNSNNINCGAIFIRKNDAIANFKRAFKYLICLHIDPSDKKIGMLEIKHEGYTEEDKDFYKIEFDQKGISFSLDNTSIHYYNINDDIFNDVEYYSSLNFNEHLYLLNKYKSYTYYNKIMKCDKFNEDGIEYLLIGGIYKFANKINKEEYYMAILHPEEDDILQLFKAWKIPYDNTKLSELIDFNYGILSEDNCSLKLIGILNPNAYSYLSDLSKLVPSTMLYINILSNKYLWPDIIKQHKLKGNA